MPAKNFNLIGGITIDQIIDCVPIFDAMLPDFWSFANEYIPKDILNDVRYNQSLLQAIQRNIWFKNLNTFSYTNNDLTIFVEIHDDLVENISVSNTEGILFSLKYENI